MARTVQKPPSKKEESMKVPNEWFNGEWWEIIPGKDVSASDPEKARRTLYQIGRYRGTTPRTRVAEGKVYLQAKTRR
jgi:hypothetical protein